MRAKSMSHSPDSTLSANSSLTDCGNFASDCESVVSATCKRKRDCESGTPLPLAMTHIVMARHNKPPYQELVLRNARAMQKEEGQKEEWQGRNQMVLLPSTSNKLSYSALENEIGYKVSKEFGYRGALAVQYGEDLLSLNLTSVETFNLLQRFGPSSDEYMAIAQHAMEARLELLRLLNDIPIGSIHSATCKRKRDCESGTPLPLAMNHIVMARHNKPPYQELVPRNA